MHGFFDELRMEHQKDGINVILICSGFIQTNKAENALITDGTKQNTDDVSTQIRMPVIIFAKKFVKAVEPKNLKLILAEKKLWMFS